MKNGRNLINGRSKMKYKNRFKDSLNRAIKQYSLEFID